MNNNKKNGGDNSCLKKISCISNKKILKLSDNINWYYCNLEGIAINKPERDLLGDEVWTEIERVS